MRGFTLLEVVIALAIAGSVLLTVISSVNHHLTVIGRDDEETRAVLLARAKMEDPDFAMGKETQGTFAPDHPGIKWQVELLPAEIPMLSRKRLTVIWGGGERDKLSLVQYVPKQ